MKKIKTVLAVILISALLITSCSSGGSGLRIGSRAPDFRLSNLQGQSVSLSGLRGKGVLLNFWSTTCPPCRLEMPYLQAVSDDWSDKGVVVLAIDIGEDAQTVKDFAQKYRYTLPILLDSGYDVAGKYSIEFTPTSYFIDRDGVIQNKLVGAFPNKGAIEKYLVGIVP